jgi:hypothetical protein
VAGLGVAVFFARRRKLAPAGGGDDVDDDGNRKSHFGNIPSEAEIASWKRYSNDAAKMNSKMTHLGNTAHRQTYRTSGMRNMEPGSPSSPAWRDGGLSANVVPDVPPLPAQPTGWLSYVSVIPSWDMLLGMGSGAESSSSASPAPPATLPIKRATIYLQGSPIESEVPPLDMDVVNYIQRVE